MLAEDLLLLLLDDETGRCDVSEADKGLAGAVLIELAMLERIGVSDKGRLVPHPGPAPEHPVLVSALDVLDDRDGRKPKDVLDSLAKGLRDTLTESLVNAGILRREKRKVLGLFPTERLPAQDATHETSVRAEIEAALGGADPSARTSALVALLSALDAVTRVFDLPDKRAATKRAKEIADGHWAAAAVRKAVEEIYAAAMVAITVTTTMVATSGN